MPERLRRPKPHYKQISGTMEIKDIIKSDSDRLFIVDPECYIIFTGETTDDINPFIRIGNWNDMPVELIPLIENIIITDQLIGNPAHEQFNIDVRHLPENRYIGSRGIVKKFLDYQKIFGLDLTNASVVDIEKDLPELSKEKNISHKDQFIGVFYRNGNFKVLLNKNTIFDLNTIIQKPINWQIFHDALSEAYRSNSRYDGAGLLVIGHNPIFYNKRQLYTYLFPDNYLRDFSLLGVDPGKLQMIFHPSLNLINISRFFKWLNNTERKVRIFCNSSDIELVKKLYSHAAIQNEVFSGLEHIGTDGLTIRNYDGTYNIKMTFRSIAPAGREMNIAYIKGPAGVKSIIGENPDALIITFTAYEDITLLLKSTDIPCLIVADGNKHVSRLAGSDRIVLYPGIHYEFRRYDAFEEMIKLSGIDAATADRITTDPEVLASELSSLSFTDLTAERRREIFNILSVARAHRYNTTDRKLVSRLRSFSPALLARFSRPDTAGDPAHDTVMLALLNGVFFPFIVSGRTGTEIKLFDGISRENAGRDMPLRADTREYYQRILDDRERLRLLIDIYTSSEKYHKKHMPELDKLKSAINARKKMYREESLSLDTSWTHSIAGGTAGDVEGPDKSKNGGAAGTSRDSSRAGFPGTGVNRPGLSGTGASAQEYSGHGGQGKGIGLAGSIIEKIRSMPAAAKIALPLLLALIIAVIILLLYNRSTLESTFGRIARGGAGPAVKGKGPVVESREIDARFKQLGKEKNIKVSDHDIFMYANQVAVKNGYHRIAETTLREKNPDWIYPQNIFIMLDEQRVVVSRGDTLWNLSKNKIIESIIKFDEAIKRINEADIANKPRLIQEARRNAVTAGQRDTLDRLLRSIPPAGPRGTVR